MSQLLINKVENGYTLTEFSGNHNTSRSWVARSDEDLIETIKVALVTLKLSPSPQDKGTVAYSGTAHTTLSGAGLLYK